MASLLPWSRAENRNYKSTETSFGAQLLNYTMQRRAGHCVRWRRASSRTALHAYRAAGMCFACMSSQLAAISRGPSAPRAFGQTSSYSNIVKCTILN
eukprot:4151604-Pleurochrysis_carterae.AAC.1